MMYPDHVRTPYSQSALRSSVPPPQSIYSHHSTWLKTHTFPIGTEPLPPDSIGREHPKNAIRSSVACPKPYLQAKTFCQEKFDA